MFRVLFVCTGNTCRSPMAEAILKSKQLANVEVRSAGVYAMDGLPASGHAQAVLTDNGIPHNHSSSLLAQTSIEWATHVLTMTASHKEAILYNFPVASDKTFTLKEFAEEGHGDVFDPYGGSKDIYRQTFEELEKTISKIVGKFSETEQD